MASGADGGGAEIVSAVCTSTRRPIPLSMDWGRLPATRMGRETPEVLSSTVSSDSVEGENNVLPPIVLGTLGFGFEYSR